MLISRIFHLSPGEVLLATLILLVSVSSHAINPEGQCATAFVGQIEMKRLSLPQDLRWLSGPRSSAEDYMSGTVMVRHGIQVELTSILSDLELDLSVVSVDGRTSASQLLNRSIRSLRKALDRLTALERERSKSEGNHAGIWLGSERSESNKQLNLFGEPSSSSDLLKALANRINNRIRVLSALNQPDHPRTAHSAKSMIDAALRTVRELVLLGMLDEELFIERVKLTRNEGAVSLIHTKNDRSAWVGFFHHRSNTTSSLTVGPQMSVEDMKEEAARFIRAQGGTRNQDHEMEPSEQIAQSQRRLKLLLIEIDMNRKVRVAEFHI